MIHTEQTYANATIGQDSDVLQDIHLPSKNIAIYQRSIDSLKPELAELEAKTVECRASGTTEEIRSVLNDYFSSHLANCPALLDDAFALLDLFQEVTNASSFRLLLATVRTDMCRKFHTDINSLRMLCTYTGPGTLWLPDEVVDPKALRAKGNDLELGIDPRHIQQAQNGEVIILKGALYPDANPILHRSPTIEEQGGQRLLLRIDTNESQNLWS